MEELQTLDIEALLTNDFDAISPQQGYFDLMGNNDFLTDNLDMPQGTQFFEVSFENETNQIKMPENHHQLNENYQENNAFFFNDPNQIQIRQNLGEGYKNYQKMNNENDQNYINSAPSTCNQNQVHRRAPVFVEVNNDDKNEFIDKMRNKNTIRKTEST